MNENRKNRDIRNLLFVLTAGVGGAGLLAALFLYYYNPSGQYLASYTMLDPKIMEEIDYQDHHPVQGKKVHFFFDHIEFSYLDSHHTPKKNSHVSLEDYQKFYDRVASEKSLLNIRQQVQDLFSQSPSSLLTIVMRTNAGAHDETTKIFQVVQFVPEDYFRVQLHAKNEGEWAYFYQKGIYTQTIHHLFTTHTNL